MKKIIQIMLIGMFIFSLVGCGSENTKETKKKTKTKEISNTQEGIIKEQVIEGFEITNVSLSYDGSMSTLVINITNTSNEVKKLDTIDIVVKGKNDQEIVTLLGYVGKEMQPKQTEIVTSMTDIDLSKAVNIEYKIVKKD